MRLTWYEPPAYAKMVECAACRVATTKITATRTGTYIAEDNGDECGTYENFFRCGCGRVYDSTGTFVMRDVSDAEILDWLEKYLEGVKWDDCLSDLRPREEDGWSLAKYVGQDGYTLRKVITDRIRKETP